MQGDRSPAPYFVVALLAAVVIWTVQQQWIQDSNPTAKNATPATTQSVRGDIRTVFSADDYPVDAQRKGEEGTVRAKLDIDKHGRVSRCTIVQSSGSNSLDDATCRIIERRARFTPAHDRDGNAVSDTFLTPPVRWQLEG